MPPGREHQSKTLLVIAVWVGLGAGPSACDKGWDGATDPLLHAVMEAENARGQGPGRLESVLEGISSSDPFIQEVAVRGLGRLENPSQIGAISSLLSSPHAGIRAQAANALSQAVFTGPGDTVGIILRAHLAGESDPQVLGAVGRALGRLSYEDPVGVEQAEASLRGLTSIEASDAPFPTLVGAVRGLEWLARRNRGIQFSDPTLRRLEALTTFGLSSPGQDPTAHQSPEVTPEEAARVRRVSLMTLAAARAASPETIQRTIQDPDPDVRRLAISAVGRGSPFPGGWPVLDQVLADPDPRVRTQALGALGTQTPEGQRCTRLHTSMRDSDTQVAIGALDLLGQRCPNTPELTQALVDLIGTPEASSPDRWHRGAHALTALAELSPQQASDLLAAFTNHVNPFARSYGARAASSTGDQEPLEILAQDPVPNVRTTAVRGLFQLRGHEVDGILLAQLKQDDLQLLQTVAGLLQDTPNPEEAVSPLLEAFHRISDEGKETARDPRLAILDRIAQVGDVTIAGELETYLSDYDTQVAERVGSLLSEWTGREVLANPRPAPQAPVPTPAELQELAQTRFILALEGGGEIELRLFPFLAPTNAARFARLARSGFFDGLTFHRVVPNFVLQGGSPGANEMAGDGPYTRDEIGLQSNWRGTVGISTRGRDTGDGQIFINLVDNLRLDHNYTIFAEVVGGMDVVDRVVEGQVIQKVEIVKP
jgi:cyclophilin family peptidyl-prolyl cis-trans isomerase/HEAT repeat protein